MKTRSFILRCAAFLLILIFSQKAGTGLYLHNLLHAGNPSSSELPMKGDRSSGEINFACSCIDDFLSPFTHAETPAYLSQLVTPVTPDLFYKEEIPFHSSIYSSLRGPPARSI